MKNKNINIYNYEIYFLDYLEGKLTPLEQNELLLFLKQYPQLSDELQQITEIKLEPNNTLYIGKEYLKKTHAENNERFSEVEYLFISEMEGDLSKLETQASIKLKFEQPELALLYKEILQTKLNPFTNEVFLNKGRLKRTPILGINHSTFKTITGIAASIILLVAIGLNFNTFLFKPKSEVIVVNNNINKNINELVNIEVENKASNVISKKQVQDVTPNENKKKIEPVNEEFDNSSRPDVEMKYLNLRDAKMTSINIAAVPLNKSILLGIDQQFAISDATSKQLAESVNPSGAKEFGLFEIAQLGVKKLSEMTGSSASLNGKRDETGNLTRVSFETSLFAISTPVSKK